MLCNICGVIVIIMRSVRLQVNCLPHFEDLHGDLAMQKSKRNFHTNALLLQIRRCDMPTKKNGAGEQQEYDESTRWYGESKTQWITSKRDFSNVQANEKDLQYDSENGKIKQNKGFINIQLFGRIKYQTPRQLKKTIRSLDKRIQEHKEKGEKRWKKVMKFWKL